MCRRLLRSTSLAGLGALALSAAPVQAHDTREADGRPQMVLMGTVPIYWGEAGDLAEMLAGEGQAHWARAALEQRFELVPVDFLSEETLADREFLLMAQPRALAPSENVALDSWVRGGGRLLLFADPLMTGHSRFGLGDRRRPQDVTLLSPILAHWGLEIRFDEAQPSGPRRAHHFGTALPFNQRGQFVPLAPDVPCTVPGDGLLARCGLGAGEALLVADAAMLDIEISDPAASAAFAALLRQIFGPLGDDAGMERADHPKPSDFRVEPDRR